MRTIETGADLVLDDGIFRVVERAGNRLHLQNQSTHQFSVMHIGDLLPRLACVPPVNPVSPRELDHLSETDRKEVEMWSVHLEEMVTGRHPQFDQVRPQYDPSTTTMNERVKAKSAEMAAFGIKASRATLYGKRALWEARGPAGLIDGRKHKKAGKLDRADGRLVDAIGSVVAAQANRSTVTEQRLHQLVEKELIIRYGADRPPLPSRATLYRYFQASTGGMHAAKATTRRSQDGTPDRTYGTRRRMLPGEEVQIDSTKLDVYVTTKTGLERPILTTMVDVATRTIVAFTIRLEATTGFDHVLLLSQALVPFNRRPDRSDHRALVQARHPNIRLLTPEERAPLERDHPFIIPRYINTDNGKDFLSDVFRSACAKYEIDLVRASIHTPTDKPHVERAFGSINTIFAQRLPGYVGNSTGNRGRNPEKDGTYDIATLTELFEDWILSGWQHRPHEGLRDPYDPSLTFSPNQWFNAVAEFSGVIDIPHDTDTFIDLLPSVTRVIGTVGINYKNRQYDSTELHPYRGRPSNLPHLGNKWEIKYNPYDVTRVWVRSPENTWIECRWRLTDSIYEPHFGDILQNLKRQERDDTAYADADRAGTPMPARTPEPLRAVTDHAWDPSKYAELDMFTDKDE